MGFFPIREMFTLSLFLFFHCWYIQYTVCIPNHFLDPSKSAGENVKSYGIFYRFGVEILEKSGNFLEK